MTEKRSTPELAKRADRRWRIAGVSCGLLGAVSSFAGLGMFAPPLLVLAHLFLLESAQQHGWRIGYRAGLRAARRSVGAREAR